MERDSTYLTVASERYLVDILSYLHVHGETNITRLRVVVANSTTLARTLDRFEEFGLLTMRKEITDRYVLRLYALTPKGKEVAELAYQFRQRMLELRIGTD